MSTFNLDSTTMQTKDLLANGKPKPCTSLFFTDILGGKEWLKDFSTNVLGHAGAIVFDFNNYTVLGFRNAGFYLNNLLFPAHRLDSIEDKIDKDLLQLIWMTFDKGYFFRKLSNLEDVSVSLR